MKINKFLIISAIFLSCFLKLYCEETNKKGLKSPLDNRFFSIGLFSSADSIKTSVNLEFGFKLFKFNNFEMKSYTSIVGSKIYDDNPKMYEYLKQNSIWYKALNRDASLYKEFENKMKELYHERATDKISDVIDNIDLIESVIMSLK